MELLNASTFILKQSVTSATPLLLAGFGELLAERAGIIDIVIEGLMLMGAISAYAAAVIAPAVPSFMLSILLAVMLFLLFIFLAAVNIRFRARRITATTILSNLLIASLCASLSAFCIHLLHFPAALLIAPIAAILAGLLFVSLFAIITIWCRADQIVTGAALNILAFGTSTTIWHALQNYMTGPTPHNPPDKLFDAVPIPLLNQIPLIGPALFNQYALFYFVALLAIALAFLNKSRFGLIIKSLGDAPDACDAAGIPVRLWRTGLTLFAGACAGLAGAYLSTMRGHSFQVNMTAGQGFLVLALVIFGRWKLSGLIAGTLLFGALDGFQSYLAAIPGATTKVPHQLFDMLPYAATLIALALLTRSRAGPTYLAVPWPPDR